MRRVLRVGKGIGWVGIYLFCRVRVGGQYSLGPFLFGGIWKIHIYCIEVMELAEGCFLGLHSAPFCSILLLDEILGRKRKIWKKERDCDVGQKVTENEVGGAKKPHW